MLRVQLLGAAVGLTAGVATPYCRDQLTRDGWIQATDKCDFSYMNLAGIDLSFAIIEGANFHMADLTGATIDEVPLHAPPRAAPMSPRPRPTLTLLPTLLRGPG